MAGMKVILLGWVGAVALVGACSGALEPLASKGNTGDGGAGDSSSSSSGGGATNCVAGMVCSDGNAMKVCTATSADGACTSITYDVGSASFVCGGCTDCLSLESAAAAACDQ